MQFIDAIIPFIIPVLGGAIGYLLARKKNEADIKKTESETDSIDIGNLRNLIEIYRRAANDLSEQVKQLRQEVFEFAEENSHLKEEIKQLSAQIQDLQKFIEEKQN